MTIENYIIRTDRLSVGNKFNLLLFIDKIPKIKVSDKFTDIIHRILAHKITNAVLLIAGIITFINFIRS